MEYLFCVVFRMPEIMFPIRHDREPKKPLAFGSHVGLNRKTSATQHIIFDVRVGPLLFDSFANSDLVKAETAISDLINDQYKIGVNQ